MDGWLKKIDVWIDVEMNATMDSSKQRWTEECKDKEMRAWMHGCMNGYWKLGWLHLLRHDFGMHVVPQGFQGLFFFIFYNFLYIRLGARFWLRLLQTRWVDNSFGLQTLPVPVFEFLLVYACECMRACMRDCVCVFQCMWACARACIKVSVPAC